MSFESFLVTRKKQNKTKQKQQLYLKNEQKTTSPGGLEPPTFRLTAERANRLRHGD